MLHEFSREELLIGENGLEKLRNSRVAIFGVGGVGSFAVEGLVRAGVGKFVLVDDDCICLTNINRQLHATRKTIGKSKVEAMKERILDINPKAEVITYQTFYMPDNSNDVQIDNCDYIIDAVDTVTAKLELIINANKLNVPIISSMGTGNKMDPTRFEITDIYKTSVCPLARVMRKELKSRHVKKLKVLYSKEEPLTPVETSTSACSENCVCPKGTTRKCTERRQIPGSISFVPSVAGLIIAGEVVNSLLK